MSKDPGFDVVPSGPSRDDHLEQEAISYAEVESACAKFMSAWFAWYRWLFARRAFAACSGGKQVGWTITLVVEKERHEKAALRLARLVIPSHIPVYVNGISPAHAARKTK